MMEKSTEKSTEALGNSGVFSASITMPEHAMEFPKLTVIATGRVKDDPFWKGVMNEYCMKHGLGHPIYSTVRVPGITEAFHCSMRFGGRISHGDSCSRVRAEAVAAHDFLRMYVGLIEMPAEYALPLHAAPIRPTTVELRRDQRIRKGCAILDRLMDIITCDDMPTRFWTKVLSSYHNAMLSAYETKYKCVRKVFEEMGIPLEIAIGVWISDIRPTWENWKDIRVMILGHYKYDWLLVKAEARNKLIHALNGNIFSLYDLIFLIYGEGIVKLADMQAESGLNACVEKEFARCKLNDFFRDHHVVDVHIIEAGGRDKRRKRKCAKKTQYVGCQVRVDTKEMRTVGSHPHDLNLSGIEKIPVFREKLKLYKEASPEKQRNAILKMNDKINTQIKKSFREDKNLVKCLPFEAEGLTDFFSSLLQKGGASVAEGFLGKVQEKVGCAVDGVKATCDSWFKQYGVDSLIFLPGLVMLGFSVYKLKSNSTVHTGVWKWVLGASIIYLLSIAPTAKALYDLHLASEFEKVGNWGSYEEVSARCEYWEYQGPSRPFDPTENQTAEMDLMTSELISKTVALFVTVFAIGKDANAKDAVSKVMKTVGEFPRFSDGLVGFMEALLKMIEKVVNAVRVYFGFDKIELLEKEYPDFDKWSQECSAIFEQGMCGTLELTRVNQQKIMSLKSEGLLMTSRLQGKNSDRVRHAVGSILRQLEEVLGKFSHFSWAANELRPEPYGLKLFGYPGIGKTTMLIPLIMYVFHKNMNEQDYKKAIANLGDHIYTWRSENEFQDGYRNQDVTVFDDRSQLKTALGQGGDDFSWVTCKNVWPLVLHMADLALKGKVKFTSSWLIATTNERVCKSENLQSPEAVERRHDDRIMVVPTVKYCMKGTGGDDLIRRRLDKSKVGTYTDPRTKETYLQFNPLVWEFYHMNMKGDIYGKAMNWDTFAAHVAKRYAEALERSAGQIDDFMRYGRSLIDQKTDIPESEIEKLHKKVITKHKEVPEGELELKPASKHLIKMEGESWFTDFVSKFKGDAVKKESKQPEMSTCNWDLLEDMKRIYPAYEVPLNTEVLKEVLIPGEDSWWEVLSPSWRVIMFNVCQKTEVPVIIFLAKNRELILKMEEKKINDYDFAIMCGHICAAMQQDRVPYVQIDTDGFTQKIKEAKEAMLGYIQQGKTWVKKHPVLATLVVVIPLALGVAALYSVLSSSEKDFEGEATGESGNTDAKGDRKPNRRVPMRRVDKEGKMTNMTANSDMDMHELQRREYNYDPSTEQLAACLLRENILRVFMPGETRPAFSVLCVGGNLAIAPSHSCVRFQKFVENKTLEMTDEIELATMVGSVVRMKATVADFVNFKQIDNWKDKDLAMIQFSSKGFPPRRDIVTGKNNKFFDVRGFSFERDWDIVLLVCRKDMCMYKELKSEDVDFYTDVKVSTMDFDYVHGGAFAYKLQTEKSFCGSTLLVFDPKSRAKKIIGFHVSGNGTYGMASALCQEDILEAQKLFKVNPEDNMPAKFGYTSESSMCDGRFTVVREEAKPSTYPVRSEIIRSPLFDTYTPHTTLPAQLSAGLVDGERVNPVLKAISRYAEEAPLLSNEDEDALKKCATWECGKMIESVRGEMLARELTFEEAVLGVPPWLKALPMDTSPGWPKEHERAPNEPGKTHWFGKGGIDLTHPEAIKLRVSVLEKVDLLKKGVPIEFVFKDFPKDERRKISRVEAFETRLISGSDLEFLIICRMLFGAFMIDYVRGKVKNGSAIGANPHGTDWELLVQNLKKINIEKLLAGDFIGMDTSTIRQILMIIVETWNTMYYKKGQDDPASIARRMLMNSIARSVHIIGAKVYLWHRAFPSGCPITAILNTFYLGVVFRWVYWRAGGQKMVLFKEYDENVYICRLGDDHIGAVSEPASKFFNMKTIEKYVPIIGMKYADASKMPVQQETMKLSEVTFLKRSFVFDPEVGRHIGTLDLGTILELPQWTKRGSQSTKIAKDNFDTAMLYLSMHSENVFNKWSGPMTTAYEKAYRVPYLSTCTELRERAFAMDAAVGVSSLGDKLADMEGECLMPAMKTEDKRSGPSRMSGRVMVNTPEGVQLGSTAAQPVEKNYCLVQVTLTRVLYKNGVASVATENTTTIASTEKQSTTTFDSNQAKETVDVRAEGWAPPADLAMDTTTHFDQGIVKVCMKPIQLAQGTVSASDVGTIFTINLPGALIANTMYKDKLKGFQLLKGTIRIRLQMNSNQYQQGRYLLVFHPQGQVAGVSRTLRFRNLYGVTTLPKVSLNLATDSEVEMVIPYVSPTEWYNLLSGNGVVGTVSMYVYSAFASGTGGGSSVGYTVFGSFDTDLKLENPTLNEAPASKPPLLGMRAESRMVMTVHKKRENVSDAESSKGPVSKILGGAGKVATLFANIPSLEPIAGTAAWVLQAMSRGTASLGWAKPYQKDVVKITNNMVPYFANTYDGPNLGTTTCQSTDCKLDEMPGQYGTKEDEMSFSFIQQQFCWFAAFTFGTSNNSGDLLYITDLFPLNFRVNQADVSISYWDYTPYGICGRFFKYWRGALQLKFISVKTGWHQGRIVISFFPGISASANPTLAQTEYAHREVIDISVGTEWTVTIPYCAATQWLSTGTTMGCVTVHVLNELVAPTTVSASTTWLVEVAGTPESMWNVPSDATFAPYMPSTIVPEVPRAIKRDRMIGEGDLHGMAGESDMDIRRPDADFLGGMQAESEVPNTLTSNAKKQLTLGGSSGGGPNMAPSQYCMGEQPLSLRQMAKMMRRSWVGPLTQAQLANISIRTNSCCVVTSDGSNITLRPLSLDYLSLIMSMYNYNRGGFAYMVVTGVNGVNLFHKTLTEGLTAAPITAMTDTTYNPYGDNEMITQPSVPVMCPAYCRNPVRLTRFAYGATDEPIDLYSSLYNLQIRAQSTPTGYILWRAGADDFGCGFFLGVPPIIEASILPAVGDFSTPQKGKGPAGFSGIHTDSLAV